MHATWLPSNLMLLCSNLTEEFIKGFISESDYTLAKTLSAYYYGLALKDKECYLAKLAPSNGVTLKVS